MQILQALGGSGGNGFISGITSFLVGTNHSGGLAGTGPKRRINPFDVLGGVPRYHSGGLVGGDEVLSLLQRNEEVLTRSDPRHVLNGGKSAGKPPTVRVYNFLDRDELMRAVADTPAGDEFVVNTINRNRSRIK